VEQTAIALPAMTGSITRTLAVVDRVTADVQRTTSRLPAILDSAQSTLTGMKRLSDTVGEVSQELIPVTQTAETTLTDVSTLIRGAKQTFPFNRFAENAGPAPKQQAAATTTIPSLRGDQVRR
jgi:ABC-type transporter Mla subunit MlaD